MARKKSNIHYIYKTTCNVTGKYYVGMHSTSNIDDGYMGSGKRLRNSIRYHGVEQHTKEILEYCTSREELALREFEIVNNELILDDLCMNLKCGGTGGFTFEMQTKGGYIAGNLHREKLLIDEEYAKTHRELMSLNLKKAHSNGKCYYDNFKGKRHSEETKKLMSDVKKGHGKGETNSQYGTCWITMNDVNKKIKKEDLDSYLLEGWVRGRK